MKKIVWILTIGICILLSVHSDIVFADSSENIGQQTIVVSDSTKNDSNKYRVYKLKNGKMKSSAKTVKIVNKKGIRHWKATKRKVNGKIWWKIGKNQYFSSNRVEIIDVNKMASINRKITNYAN